MLFKWLKALESSLFSYVKLSTLLFCALSCVQWMYCLHEEEKTQFFLLAAVQVRFQPDALGVCHGTSGDFKLTLNGFRWLQVASSDFKELNNIYGDGSQLDSRNAGSALTFFQLWTSVSREWLEQNNYYFQQILT